MDSLFGAEGSLIVRFVVAFVIVLALIGLTFWLIRRFGTARVGAAAQRGRQPRLAVIDAAPVDGRRRLVLVRRDNVEHLLMIGGPTDIVVEQNIVRAVPVNAPRDVPVPRQPGAEGRLEAARAQPLDEDWLQPEPAPRVYARPEPPVRTPRPPLEPRPLERPLEQRPLEQRSLEPRPVERAEPRPFIEPPRARHCPRAFASPPRRRSYRPLSRPKPMRPMRRSPTWRSASKPRCAVPARPSRGNRAAAEPELARAATDHRARPCSAAGRMPKPAKPKSVLDSLEEEMASLLGRPPEKQ